MQFLKLLFFKKKKKTFKKHAHFFLLMCTKYAQTSNPARK